jgi:23S rRNA (cytidine1920-2'-O)/16S rRNA (cytidine1409-2'-O)-methyltransferase
MSNGRRRADLLLVERGIFESRAKAQAAIAGGLVSVDGMAVRKASDLVAEDAEIEAEAPYPYVSRGGLKLAAALDAFGIDPRGRICLDVGASTGGFTDVLLRRGAAHVHAVDVGRDQLHRSLAADPRVTSREGTDIRSEDPVAPLGAVDLVVADVSFISLSLVLPGLVRYMKVGSQLIVLIKPQFEVGRAGIGRGGIVRDDELRRASVERIRGEVEEWGFSILGIIPSPVPGGDGNQEFLLGATRV